MSLLNEFRYLLKQPINLAAMILCPLFAFALTQGIPGSETLAIKQLLFLSMTALMMTLPVLVAVLFPQSILRDQKSQMWELIQVTPISSVKRRMIRWAALCLMLMAVMAINQGVVLSAIAASHNFETVLLSATLFMYAIVILPSLLFLSGLGFWLSQKSGNAMWVYILFALFWLGYVVLSSMSGSPLLAGSKVTSQELYQAMTWLDPYAITGLMAQLQDGVNQVSLDERLLINRLFYAVLGFVFTWLALTTTSKAKQKAAKKTPSTPFQTTRFNASFKLAEGSLSSVKVFKELVSANLRGLLSHKVTWMLMALWAVVIFGEISASINYAEANSVLDPTSIDALNRIVWDAYLGMGMLAAITWSWLICWRGKNNDFAEIIAATPINNKLLIISQLVSQLLIMLVFITVTALVTLTTETMFGSEVVLSAYFTLLPAQSLPLILFAASLIAVHNIFSTQAKAAAALAVYVIIKFTPVTSMLGITHMFWRFFDAPLRQPDLYWGFESSISSLLPFMGMWLLLVITLFLIAFVHSHCGTSIKAIKRFKPTLPVAIMTFITLVYAIGLDQQLRYEVGLMHATTKNVWRANYEKRYIHWQEKAQPVVSHINSAVDFYPQQQYADIAFELTLTNKTGEPVEQILVGGHWQFSYQDVSLEAAELVVFDEQLNQRIYQLEAPLLPGESLQLKAQATFEQPQLWPARMHQMVKPEFSYLRSVPLLPTIGFFNNIVIKNNDLRADLGLAQYNQLAPSVAFANSHADIPLNKTSMHSVVSTEKGQTAITQGELVNQWHKQDRAYFEYQTAQPIRFIPAWLSTQAKPLQVEQNDVRLQVFAQHHNEAAEINLKAMQDTVDWFETNIAPYPGEALSLLSMPSIGGTGYALPQLMLINHRVGFRAYPDTNAGYDQRYRRAAHETAHQWFGHKIGYGVDGDNAFLIESMAKYVELVLLEKHYGPESMQALVDYEHYRFTIENARNQFATVSLIDAQQSFDQYSRATLVFHKLRETIGDKVIIQALKIMFARYQDSAATSMDFVRLLKASASEKDALLIDELLLGTDVSMLVNKD